MAQPLESIDDAVELRHGRDVGDLARRSDPLKAPRGRGTHRSVELVGERVPFTGEGMTLLAELEPVRSGTT